MTSYVSATRCLGVWLAAMSIAWPVMAKEQVDKSAPDLLPPSTLVYFEWTDTGSFLDLLEGPLMRKIQSTPQSQQAWNTPRAKELKSLVAVFEERLGLPWPRALRTLTDGGVHVGFDPITAGVAFLIRTSDEPLRNRFVATALELARWEAAGRGQDDPTSTVVYRGQTIYKTRQGGMASIGPWLLVTNSEKLGKWVIDSHLDTGRVSLAGDTMYQDARASRGDGSGWAYTRLDTLRVFGAMRALPTGRHGNPLVEYMFGGIIDALGKAPYAMADFSIGPKGLSLSLAAPYDAPDIAAQRLFYFAPHGGGSGPKPLNPDDTILNFSIYRDLAAMWLAAPELFNDNVATQLAQADSQLSNFFGGRSFSQEILKRIKPRVQVVVARREPDEAAGPVPAIKLPGAALVLRVEDPQIMLPYMQMAFQTLVSIVNIQSAMQGAPTLMINNEKRDGLTLSSAQYLTMPDEMSMKDGPIHYNFTPTMATIDDVVIIASTAGLAQDLARLASEPASNETIPQNTFVRLDGPALHRSLGDNRSQLVAQTMILTGVDKATAEAQVETGLDILSHLRDVRWEIAATDGQLQMTLGLELIDKE